MHTGRDPASQVASAIGETVRRERNRLGLRQDELAVAAGVSTRFVHQVEHGKATSRLDSLVRLLDALGLAVKIEGAEAASAGGQA